MAKEKESLKAKEAASSAPVKMKRNLSLFNVVAMLVSITGHISIFITPGIILEMSGSVLTTFIVWIVGTFLVYSLALCFTEMGTIFQGSGGPYMYLTLTFGNFWGYLIAWSYIILISGPFLGFASQTAAVYIVQAVTVMPSGKDCHNVWHVTAVMLLAGWILTTLFYLNCFYLKLVVRMQSLLTACKMVTIAMVIIAGLYSLGQGSTETFENPTEGSTTNVGRISLALIYVIFSNGGWQAVTTLTEEVKDPSKTLPRAVHITFGINILLMMLSYVAYLSVLDKREVMETSAVAVLFFQHLWPPMVPVISMLVALASIGALNTALMGHSRMLYAASRKGDMPCVLGTLHPECRTPMVAIFAVFLYGSVMMLSGGTKQFMQFIGLCSLTLGLNVVVALLYLRYTQPHLHRPYKVPLLFPILQVVVNIFLLVFVIYQEPTMMSYGILIYLAGVPLYIVGVSWKNKPKSMVRAIGRVTSLIQKVFIQVPS